MCSEQPLSSPVTTHLYPIPYIHRAIIIPTRPRAPAAIAPEIGVGGGARAALVAELTTPLAPLFAALATLLAPLTPALPTLLAPLTATLPALEAFVTATLKTEVAPLTTSVVRVE